MNYFTVNEIAHSNNKFEFSICRSLKEMSTRLETAKLENDQLISELQTETQSLLEKVAQLTSNENELKQNATESELNAKNEIDRLQNELSNLLKAKENIDSEHKQAIDQLNAMQKKMEDAQIENDQTVSSLQEKVQTLTIELERFTCQESELLQNVNENEAKAKSEVDRLRSELTEMATAKDSIDLERKQLAEQLKHAEDTKIESQKSIASLQSEVQSLSTQIERLTSNENELKQSIDEYEVKSKNDIDRLQNELTSTTSAKHSAEIERSHLVDQLDSMNKEMEVAKHENGATIAKLQAEVQSLTAQLARFTSNENELKQNVIEKEMKAKLEIANLQDEVTDLKKAKECIELERRQLIEQLNSMTKTMEDNKHETEKTIANLQSKIQLLQAQLDQQANTEKESKQNIEEMKNDIARLQNELDAVQKAKDCIELERKQLADRLNVLEKKKSVSMVGTSPCHKLKFSIPKHDQSMDMQKLRDENRLLQTQQQQLQEEIDTLRKSTNCDRKKKRQSIHDDTRRLSGFDATMIDIGQQTDPVDQKCACIELSYKVINKCCRRCCLEI